MEIRILGPLEAVDDGRRIALGGSKQRALLALLALQVNETVSPDRLIDELWGERPPATASKALQVHVFRLRKALAAGGEEGAVVTRAHGYELALERERVDACRFERLLEEGRRALGEGAVERAETTLEAALALWRGAPLVDLAHEPFVGRHAARLEDLRVVALELVIEAKLAHGRHDEVIDRLETLIAEHPYRERFRAQLMLALYRADRQADALQAYRDARRTLSDELGLEPGQRLRELERAILAQDPALSAPAARVFEPRAAGFPERPPVPRPLRIAAGASFVARERELARLRELWANVAGGSTVRAVVMAGEAGIGKTRLAAELAAHVHSTGGSVLYGRCDEILAVPYQPFVEALRPAVAAMGPDRLRAGLGDLAAELVRLFPGLQGVGKPARTDPESERFALFEAVGALAEALTRERRALLVLDDLHWAATPTVLLAHHLIRSTRSAPLLILVTYRDTDLDAAHPLPKLLADLQRDACVERITLGGLDERAVATLLSSAAPRLQGLADRVHADTNGNPFFIRELLAHLLESRGLEAPAALRDVVAQRVARLSGTAQRVLSMAAVAGPGFSVTVLEHALDEEPDLLDALDEATAAGLLVEAGHGDYAFAHELVRQTIYGGLSAARRARSHRRIGEALERLPDPDAHAEALAQHFAEAATDGQARKAADYALAAGRSAIKRLGYDEAAAHYRRGLHALDVAGEPRGKRRRELELALARTRYEPLPDLGELPAWLWRRLPRAAKPIVALLPVLVLGLALALGPGIERLKRERSRADDQRLERIRTERVERIRAEQRPRLARGAPAGTSLTRRADLLRTATGAVDADVRTRVASGALDGPILRVECEPYPRTVDGIGADRDPGARSGRYQCLAVTSEVPPTARSPAGANGHPYRVRIDFESGRYGLCKIARSAAKALAPEPIVAISRDCGGT